MMQKIFIRVKLFCAGFKYFLQCCKIVYYAVLTGINFCYLYKHFQKMPIMKNFLTKFVNINNHTHNFLYGVLRLQEAKNYIQHEEIFAA